MKITDYFKIYQNKFDDPGEAAYHGSLVPYDAIAQEIKKITFYVEYDNHLKSLPEIHHRNQVNSHIFKPRYYSTNQIGAIECSVPNKQVFIHTLRSLAFWFFFHYNKDVEISISYKKEKYINHCNGWKIGANVFIGRSESVLNCLRYLTLLNLGYPREIINKLILEQENNRLKQVSVSENDYFRRADEVLKVDHYKTNNPRISLINCIYKNKPLSLVQLPWGIDMSKDLVQALFEINPKIEKIGVVGGIGYVGSQAVSVDDIMIPETLTLGNDFLGYTVLYLNNNFSPPSHLLLSRQKRICSGSLYTIVPQENVQSNSYLVANNGGTIDGFDMELAGFVKALKNHPETKTSYVYYIMDIPEKGLGLGQTYYNLEFLSVLFSNVNRGKHYCIESTINYLIN